MVLLPALATSGGAMKRIFLTGASSGIGLATAQALLARGDEVWGTSRNAKALLVHQRFHPVRLDLRDNRDIEEAFNRAVGEAGHFDAVINNAGSGHFGPAELLSAEEIADQFQVVFLAHVKLMQVALGEMRRRGHGLIINVTSLASLLPVPFMGAYNAAKSAMASFTMSLQIELGKSKVRIVDLQPGDIRTNFNDVVTRNADTGYQDRVAKTWIAVDKNMKEAPGPEVVARAILKLIDQKNPPMRVIVGDTFQTKIAPFIFRFLPQRTRIWGLKKYYGI
jgi:NAD(P)-dependent dehydrogenase (short-subunit alcohol dehydrogenase family)